ncbi:MAG: QueT transporter family protein [Oscillospiraceae bacterium]
MNMKKTLFICHAAMIAAIYVALTWLASVLGLSSQAIQVRFSEALCVLPCFTSAAIPGLTIGCFVANLVTGCMTLDVILGTTATLIGAVGTYLLKKHKILMLIPPIMANTIIVPFVLKIAYQSPDAYWFMCVTVFIGEVISVGVLGMILYSALNKTKVFKR